MGKVKRISSSTVQCKYYEKENPPEHRCVMDSSCGYCIVEFGDSCKYNDRGYLYYSDVDV